MTGEAPDAEESRPPRERILALDGLRGLAASSVVLAHAMSVPAKSLEATLLIAYSPIIVFANGLGGVHVFFVLSGYCLSSSASRAWSRLGLLQFYLRRIFRIYPPYLVGLLIAWLLAGGIYADGDGGDFLTQHIADLRRYRLPLGKLLWAMTFPGGAYLQIPVGWTLYVEMIFSFLLPFMLWIATRAHWTLLLAISAPALLLSPDLQQVHRIFQPSFPLYTIDFALGIGIYCERDRLTRLFGRLNRWVSAGLIAAALLVMASPRYYQLDVAHPKQSLLLYVSGAAVLVAAAIHSPGFRRFLSLGPIAWIGRISFSVYLVHVPIILILSGSIDHMLSFWEATFFVAVSLLATYLIAPILHAFVEEPSIRMGYRVSTRIGARAGSAAKEAP